MSMTHPGTYTAATRLPGNTPNQTGRVIFRSRGQMEHQNHSLTRPSGRAFDV